jgi:nucleotide-binding universal stress UspA family protein
MNDSNSTLPEPIVASSRDEKSVTPSTVDFKRILAPIDFSDRSREVLRYAANFARRHGATLIVLHVVEPLVYPSDADFGSGALEAMETTLNQSATAKLKDWCEREAADGITVERHVRIGNPYFEITEAAKSERADIIVLSTHGYTGLKHVLLGSTAERVVRHATCPVLTLHQS